VDAQSAYSLPSFFSHARKDSKRQRLFIFAPIRRFLACHNVVNVSDREALRLHVPLPRVLKRLDSIGGNH
jgi:hypothetical protein